MRHGEVAKLQSAFSKQSLTPDQSAVERYARRWIRFLGYWEQQETVFKIYGISIAAEFRSPGLLDAALETAVTHLRQSPTRHAHYCAGFISVHEGRGENQLNIDRWVNENELLHYVYVSSTEMPTRFRTPPRDHNSVCIWEIYLQSFERKAWLDCVLQGRSRWSSRLKRYYDQRLRIRG